MSGADTDPATVLVLVANDANRSLLADRLERRYDVRTDAAVLASGDVDLCLLDEPSLGAHQGALNDAVAGAAPTFLPALLLTDDRGTASPGGAVWDVVDEVIQRPVNASELDVRIENLLERRRLSVELSRQRERSERRFESLFDSTPDPVVVLTSDGTITEANEAFLGALGRDVDDVVGRTITDLEFSPSDAVERLLLRVRDAPATTTVEWTADDGEPHVAELNADVVHGLEDAAERIGIFRDVTARVERTEELTRQQERLEKFAETVAHDLRNPLSIARGHLDLARETGEQEHFDAVAESHERMTQLIDELLSLAKEGQVALDPDPVSLAAVAEEAWGQVRSPDAALAVEVDPGVRVRADESRLAQLFENLFRNAVEHGGTRAESAVDGTEPAVAISVGLVADRDGFYVADDGPGIPPAEREAVTRAGYSDAEDGTGFGLSIVTQIARGHDWDVSIAESDAGGARVEVTGVDLCVPVDDGHSAGPR